MKKILPIVIILAIILITTPLIGRADVTIENPLKYNDIKGIITALTGLLKGLAIVLGSIMIIISGIQYMTSGGNEEKLNKAKKTMFWTVIGVAIVVAVDFITGFIGEILGKL